jgi:hypothetical protein
LHQVGDLFELNVKLRCRKVIMFCVKVMTSLLKAQKGGGGVAPFFSQLGTVWTWVVSTTLRQLYPQERLGVPFTEGWLGFGTALDGKEDLAPFGYDPQTFQAVNSRCTFYDIPAACVLCTT